MIPFFRSLNELMAITQSNAKSQKIYENNERTKYSIIKDKKTNLNKSVKMKKKIILPNLPKSNRRKWIKSKEAVSKFLDNFDYNNQIQSSLDLTLLERQNKYEHRDIA